MADCECLPKCLFFNDQMANMPAISEMFKKKYCNGDFSQCARYMVFKAVGKEKVPNDLFPNNTDGAEKTILEG